ncbi:MAG: beta-1,6-N-acetylglucosaminyltransferase [Tabrizicola sp.]|nr:beta-1,6-N-acetylglucosaminyltransferase [Tabrizicola sp.]
MTLGIVMLCHTALDRAAQVARHWAVAGCPVVLHVDAKVPAAEFGQLQTALADLTKIRFSRRFACEWGTWSLVEASQIAATAMLSEFPEVRHVYLTSGSCLPLRPVAELRAYLDSHPRTDFIESVMAGDVGWTVGGLDLERFTLRFPFSWRRQRKLFDAYVTVQRKLGIRRRIPAGITPHLGSQWWCLTRQSLSAVLESPDRAKYDDYFKRVWIPDESYFQTLIRLVSAKLESRSLTLAKFDVQGRPHIFYDDHRQLLRRSECFVARKIWPHAEGLYDSFLAQTPPRDVQPDPNPTGIDRLFSAAKDRRLAGRTGLYMQSRFPHASHGGDTCAAPYSVLAGFSALFENFADWLSRTSATKVHGHLFAPDRVEFAGNETVYAGGLSDNARHRDYNPRSFLTSLIWNTRGEHQSFQFAPADAQPIASFIAQDPNARVSLISGAFLVPLFQSNRNFGEIRAEAARLQKIEGEFLSLLRGPKTRARVRIWTLAEFIESPMAALQSLVSDIAPRSEMRVTEVPKLVDLQGFDQFLQNLRNQGMQLTLLGDLSAESGNAPRDQQPNRPYVVR